MPQYSTTKKKKDIFRVNDEGLRLETSSSLSLHGRNFVGMKFWELMVSGSGLTVLSHSFLHFMLVSRHINEHWH